SSRAWYGRTSITNRRSPAFTRWLSTTCSSVIGPLTCGAIPTTLARTAASSVRGWMSLRRHAAARARTAPTTMRRPMTRPVRGSGSGLAGDGVAILRPVEQEPHGECQERPQARVDQEQRPQVGLEPGRSEELSQERGDDHADRHANDPRRKERALDVDDGVTCRQEGGRPG